MISVCKKSFTILLVLVSPFAIGDETVPHNPFSWDISYTTVFSEHEVPQNDTMLKYFNDAFHRKGQSRKMHLPNAMFADIDMAAIKTAILIDYQVFWYMGHRSSTLYLSDGQTVTARTYDSKSNKVKHYKVHPASYEKFSESIMNRNQSIPLGSYKFKIPKGYSFSGYTGVVSRYSIDGAAQQLMTVEDLLNKKMEPGELGKLVTSMQRKMKPVYKDN